MKAFRDVEDQERFFRRVQADKYSHLYTATFVVPYSADGTTAIVRNAIMQVEEDADFHITHLIGSVIEPVAIATLQRSEPLDPTFQMAGTDSGRTDRGLDFRMSDPGAGRLLTGVQNSRNMTLEDAFIPLSAILAPGYSFRLGAPVPFDYYIERKRRLILEVRNRATLNDEDPNNYGARVTFGFLGHRVTT